MICWPPCFVDYGNWGDVWKGELETHHKGRFIGVQEFVYVVVHAHADSRPQYLEVNKLSIDNHQMRG